MIRKSAFTGWSALKDSYHLQQARESFSEPDYLNALAQSIQDVKPGTCFRDTEAAIFVNSRLINYREIELEWQLS